MAKDLQTRCIAGSFWRKAHEAASDYLYGGIAETGISDTDFRVLEVLLHKGPLPVNTVGPKVHLTPGSISVAVDRLLEKGLVSRGGKTR
jgi:MarR family 2-MHQ and catechol resistance regulon transcriptional repressor